ncbi:conserved Plasmodium protein, unknown function [Plasmodium berghei]|uniref:RNA-binding protein 25, putative n=2 Tax=Plasmodium berghei TaxID=5821 RepID=A0A509AJ91_PLABA|nr:RNA-binding protein 25, putative [Plasmodium berghei ANKA]SCM19199.1 conserved Plasmodium protein, unknown function [Plasmodium berghei]SCN21645.1 conserved Plasmodium protein, unknown function [Plasmodium berghei]SCO58956.1 conserved Plasmodium protein, unknown function [Plasmodium berghei]VUC53823.1 RNA-binding protein 25, putative [Plasmodium berghei ANKA]|eukprot:XP_034419687.1 RNA-binding protein 25, putative [Plasmodium berghei ANKA]
MINNKAFYTNLKPIVNKDGEEKEEFENQGNANNVVYIGNISKYIEEENILKILKIFGDINNWHRQRNPSTNELMTFGFCEYKDIYNVYLCINILNNIELCGKKLKVNCNDNLKKKFDSIVDILFEKREVTLFENDTKNINEENTVNNSLELKEIKNKISNDIEQDLKKKKMDVLKFIGDINNDYEKNGKNDETERGEYNNVNNNNITQFDMDNKSLLNKKIYNHGNETNYNENNNKLINQEKEKRKYVTNNYKIHWRERDRIEKLDAREKNLEKDFYKREKEWLELEEQIKKDTYREWNKFIQIKKKDIAKLIELDLKGENEDSSISSSKRRESRRSKRAKEKKLDEQDRLDEMKELEEAKKKEEQIKDIDITMKDKEGEILNKKDKQNSDTTVQTKTKKSSFFATAFSYVFDNNKDKQNDKTNENSEKGENENHDIKQLNQNENEKNHEQTENSEIEKEHEESIQDKDDNTNKKKSSKNKRKITNSETEKVNDKKKKVTIENIQNEEDINKTSGNNNNNKTLNTKNNENTEEIQSLEDDPIIAYELEISLPKKRKGKNDTSKTIDIIEKSKKILENIPSEEEDIFNYPIEWDILKLKDNISTNLKPWIYKNITEYIGADEKEVIEEISSFFVEQILKETAPKDILSEAEKFLDSDGKKFIINMYRLIIFEQLKIKNNM